MNISSETVQILHHALLDSPSLAFCQNWEHQTQKKNEDQEEQLDLI